MTMLEELGAEIRRARLSLGWTQKELARRSGLTGSQAAISRLESGECGMRVESVLLLAAALGRRMALAQLE